MKASYCHWAGCTRLTTGYYCEQHTAESKRRRQESDRERYARMRRYFNYQSPAWKKFSAELTKEAGHCAMCGGVVHLECHHVKPVREHPELAFNKANIMVLCRECHRLKTQQEQAARARNR